MCRPMAAASLCSKFRLTAFERQAIRPKPAHHQQELKVMDIRPIADGFAVTGQITARDVKTIAEAGYKTIISNRPDSEDGAVPHGDIEKAAEAAGLKFVYLPVVSGAMTTDNVRDM